MMNLAPGFGEVLISARNLKKIYRSESDDNGGAAASVEVLKGVSIDIRIGERLCIMGSSGAGKSTLLHLLGALDRPSDGIVKFRNQELNALSDDELSRFRNRSMGFVFQFHHLLSEFTALENVMMPCLIAGENFPDSTRKAERFLAELGLSERLSHKPAALSGGERQRVAIARALVREPAIIFADEPTGNLDRKNGQQVQALLFDLQKKRNHTLVAVTHDYEFARLFPRVLTLRDGQFG